jgi:hypothetical protein
LVLCDGNCEELDKRCFELEIYRERGLKWAMDDLPELEEALRKTNYPPDPVGRFS